MFKIQSWNVRSADRATQHSRKVAPLVKAHEIGAVVFHSAVVFYKHLFTSVFNVFRRHFDFEKIQNL